MDDLYIGNGDDVKHISKASIKNIKIPIPPIEKQNEIIEYCENNNNIIKQLKNDLQQYIKNININF